jgi:hypothetical protein
MSNCTTDRGSLTSPKSLFKWELYRAKVNFSSATSQDVFPQFTENESRLLDYLEAEKFQIHFMRMIYPDGENPVDEYVVVAKHRRYCMVAKQVKEYPCIIELLLLYRHVLEGELKNYKAATALRKFESAVGRAGYAGIILTVQPVLLSQRLPFRELDEPDEYLDSKEMLVRFYERHGYIIDGDFPDSMFKPFS